MNFINKRTLKYKSPELQFKI